MIKFSILFFFISLAISQGDDNQLLCEPFGARITLGYYYTPIYNHSSVMKISFNTNYSCPDAYVLVWGQNVSNVTNYTQIETDLLNMTAIYENFSQPLNYTYFTYVRRLSVPNLQEGQNYTYEIYGNSTTEPLGPFTFYVPYRDYPDSQTLIFMGDMDSVWFSPNVSNATFNWLQNQVATNQSAYDALVFLGDMAYNLEAQDCYRGDFWLRNISDVFTPYWPFMVVPGNHDAGNDTDFPMLRKYFWEPQLEEINTVQSYYNFYSYNLGYAHFINFNPYWQVYNFATAEQNETLYAAFRADLIEANRTRAERPWIIITSHYPIYCSNPNNTMCSQNFLVLQNYTDMFQEFKVDLYIGAHQHDYERDQPTYNNVTVNFISPDQANGEHIIQNSQAPINIVEGAAGNNYQMPDEIYQVQPYTEFQSIALGVGVLKIINQTHIYWEQISVTNNTVIDYLTLIKPLIQTNVEQDQDNLIWIYVLSGLTILIVILIGLFFYRRHLKKKEMEQQDTEGYAQFTTLNNH